MKRLRESTGTSDTPFKTIKSNPWTPKALELLNSEFDSITYISDYPTIHDPIILGVDEAGRGPILGPMVYTLAYCSENFTSKLKQYGFNDSKVLKHDFRQLLYKLIDEPGHELNKNIGYLTRMLSAKDISSGMLRVHGKGAYNLNEQAHDTTIDLIKELVKHNYNISHVYIDTVGTPEKYQAKLVQLFPGIQFTVAKKADSKYPIVSCASIIAKVTRDLYLNHYNELDPLMMGDNIGSGYPSDPITSTWLKEHIDKVFGWHFGLLRYSWQTAKDSLINNGAVKVTYEQVDKPFNFKVLNAAFGDAVNI